MKTSINGLSMIKMNEGWVPKIYKDSAGLDTIGYGHLLTSSDKMSKKFENGITEAQGIELLKADLGFAESAVNELVKVSLKQNQFDALVDFVFNVGRSNFSTSRLLKRLNEGQYAVIPSELMRWNKVRDPKTKQLVESNGLTKRRQRESQLWQTG